MDLPLVAFGTASVVVLLLFSAFFSSSETAIFSLPVAWIDDRAATGDRRAVTLRRLREDPHRLLVTILVGNNLVNVAISSIVTVLLVEHVSAGVAVTAATLVVGSVVLVFGEIVPKSFGLGNARRWSLTVARPVSLVERSISPLVGLFDALTRRLTAWLGGETDIEKPYVE
ncbi:protein of unknown function DUF21 [Halogeometricum rufum]|uniref:CNNM transmembrane domain-containing protein n=1 Tax=Halogeometricum rufum TaxID=553469 RepID=A0A1I6GF98_9EURY|nr:MULTISPECIES: DUF21 domain-containing protein [Halogeometricum]MUV58074.1 DUF21 domain-containing protein [Halogeometricum sp. CBA1124]SFR40866.1 protein of unknown function DUF21 [Halogeometricum rufum]